MLNGFSVRNAQINGGKCTNQWRNCMEQSLHSPPIRVQIPQEGAGHLPIKAAHFHHRNSG